MTKQAKIYTKTGDQGQTSLVDGKRVSKSSPRIDAYGTVDELNSHLGKLQSDSTLPLNLAHEITWIQNRLFDIGSQLACEDEAVRGRLPAINANWSQRLEKSIDQMTEALPVLQNFILPGGSPEAAQAHVCRTVCRRAERLCVELNETSAVATEIVIFLNRLSDYLFVLSRHLNHAKGIDEIIWKKT